MKIFVCVKHVPDSAATIAIEGKNRIRENITYLINPYDEHAVTEAEKIKASRPEAEVIAVCLGPPAAETTLRSAMAMGADRSILIQTDRPCDSISTARALAAAIRTEGPPAMILTGKEAIDTEGMQTHFRLARNLNLPVATNVIKVDLEADRVRVVCEREAGTVDIVRMRTPCVIGAGRALNTPRYPTFPDIMKSRRKEVKIIEPAALGFEQPDAGTHIEVLTPAVEERHPRRLTGSADEIANRLVDILKNEARVI